MLGAGACYIRLEALAVGASDDDSRLRTGPFTVEIDEGAAYGCADANDLNTCDPNNLAMGDTLPLQVVAPANEETD